MQLVAYGAQDVYLTGSPQITFFKLVYRRHTNFAVESIEQTFNGMAGWGKKASATISRNGDLISGIFLQVTVPEAGDDETGDDALLTDASDPSEKIAKSDEHTYQYVNGFMHRFLESCEIEIGGQRIDKHYSHFYEVCDELMTPEEKRAGYGKMVGKLFKPDGATPDDDADGAQTQLQKGMGRSGTGETTFYLPLRFWFNNNPGLALPLIALQYHEVKVQMSFAKAKDLVINRFDSIWMDRFTKNSTTGAYMDTYVAQWNNATNQAITSRGSITTTEPTVSLYVDYVYLDTEERRRFAQASHEYLIEQLQFTGAESYTLNTSSPTFSKVRLNFNHPTKELLWFVHRDDADDNASAFNMGESVKKIQTTHLDSKNRPHNIVDDTSGATTRQEYVTGVDYVTSAKLLLNGHDRFSSRPGSYFRLVTPFQCHTRVPMRHIYCYSFALRPEEHQPSGTCNFSRIDNASLHLQLSESSDFDIEQTPDTTAENRYKVKTKDEPVKLYVYALSYNILRIVSGMGGLAYSN